jgi:hypothetical protein
MADLVPITPGAGVSVLSDEVTDGVLGGPAQKQLIGLVDATVNGTNKLIIDGSGAARVYIPRPATAAVTSVSASASSVVLIAANTARYDLSIYNNSTVVLYVRCGTVAASSSIFTAKLEAGGYFEPSYGYTGEIRGIWASATGAALITEYT